MAGALAGVWMLEILVLEPMAWC